MAATVVLVHGAWHGAWCWDLVAEQLRAEGIPVVALDLPGHGASTDPLGDLSADAAALRAVLDGIDDAVVCGHSYGGAVLSEGAADHPAVRHLVFLAAILLDVGESCAASVTTVEPVDTSALGDALVRHDDGTVTVDPEAATNVFFHDCSPSDAAAAVARLGPQRADSLATSATRAAWRDTPSTYALCAADRAVPPSLQRAFAARAGQVVVWPTSHSPFLSRPDLVASLLAGRAQVPT